ncbi:protein of unknown function [Nitrospina watsonii]|uniref:Uncharacterized protein n=1 Tax=Nitrospina watsonii TaxID=1323948 RepID=A0ABM9HF86_9BACT|nr:protein of unknown function [Nitrospina watsonii]
MEMMNYKKGYSNYFEPGKEKLLKRQLRCTGRF